MPSNESGSNRRAPIHIAFGSHSEDVGSRVSIDLLKGIAKSYLRTSPTGRVVWFIEAGYGTKEIADDVRAWRPDGVTSQIEVLRGTAEPLRDNTTFSSYELGMISQLSREYPNRIVITTESRPVLDVIPDLFTLGAIDQDYNLFAKGLEGLFLKNLPPFRDAVGLIADRVVRNRNGYITNVLRAEADDPETLAVVGHMGATHTEVYHKLQQARYDVTRSFPQKEGKVYLYSPVNAMIRRLAFFPDQAVSKEQWLKTLAQQTICELLVRRRALSLRKVLLSMAQPNLGFTSRLSAMLLYCYFRSQIPVVPQTEQGIYRLVYKATRSLSAVDIEFFDDAIQGDGIISAVKDLIYPS